MNHFGPTKQKILDTAERLFGQHGYAATSLRQIIAQAGVNLAAIHYHFGSKEELLDGIVLRKVTPVNERRMALLAEIEAENPSRPDLERILDAFLMPMADQAADNPDFVRLMGRLMAEGILPDIFRRHFQSLVERFTAALARALPELPPDELTWRIHFMVGAIAQTMCGAPVLPSIAPENTPFHDRLRRLSKFLAGGFRAPLPILEPELETVEVK
jgi:AcrR family transcriptional regulator